MKSRLLFTAAWVTCALAQQPPRITLSDALTRARQFAGPQQSAAIAIAQATEDRLQARAARLPSANVLNQFTYTQPNGTSTGVFVANNGVRVYDEQLVVHQELLSIVRSGEFRRALAAEAVARARGDIAVRGLNVTVIQNYYAIPTAERKLSYAQTSVKESRDFLEITQKQEKGGEAAHADVVKAQILVQQRVREVSEAQLAVDKAKIELAVLILPDLATPYSVADDLEEPAFVPPLEETRARASASSPDLKAGQSLLLGTGFDVKVTRYAYLPSFSLDVFYGINANNIALHTRVKNSGEPPFDAKNLGYSALATLNIPVWNWGTTRSKVKQAELRRDQARLDLSLAERALASNAAAQSREAQTAQSQIASLRESEQLSSENLRLTLLRYQAGEATAFEVVDAQATLNAARNAWADGLARFRVAYTNLQNLMGTL